MTVFKSYEYGINEEQLAQSLESLDNVGEVILWDINLLPSGHGHYAITAKYEVDGQEILVKTKTSNMELVDAWKSGMKDLYEDGEDGFDNWDEVAECMLGAINAMHEIEEI